MWYSRSILDKTSEYFSFILKINDEFYIVITRHCVIPASTFVLFPIENRIHGCFHRNFVLDSIAKFQSNLSSEKTAIVDNFTLVTET